MALMILRVIALWILIGIFIGTTYGVLSAVYPSVGVLGFMIAVPMAIVVPAFLAVPYRNRIVVRLRTHHSIMWETLGKPRKWHDSGLFWSKETDEFVKSGEHEALDDPYLDADCKMLTLCERSRNALGYTFLAFMALVALAALITVLIGTDVPSMNPVMALVFLLLIGGNLVYGRRIGRHESAAEEHLKNNHHAKWLEVRKPRWSLGHTKLRNFITSGEYANLGDSQLEHHCDEVISALRWFNRVILVAAIIGFVGLGVPLLLETIGPW